VRLSDARILCELDATQPGVVVGRHAIWVPQPPDGGSPVKMPFQCGGRICKYTRPTERTYDRQSLRHEVAILCALAELGMAPPIGGWVFVRRLVSMFGGHRTEDDFGAWGYEMADAGTLPPGRFDIDAMRALPIEGSPGAWGDVEKPGNVVNGYLVDVRRSAFDMLRWTGDGLPMIPVKRGLCPIPSRVLALSSASSSAWSTRTSSASEDGDDHGR